MRWYERALAGIGFAVGFLHAWVLTLGWREYVLLVVWLVGMFVVWWAIDHRYIPL